MADVLKQTLFWASTPTFTIEDPNETGLPNETSAITAAQSHDSSDSTFEGLEVPCVIATADGEGAAKGSASVGTASTTGGISFLRFKFRGKVVRSGSTGTVSGSIAPVINETNQVSDTQTLTSSFANYSKDYTTDPIDSQSWTNTKVNAQTFGAYLLGDTNDSPGFLNASQVSMSEFWIELWGPEPQIAALAVATVAHSVVALAVAVSLAVATAACTHTATAPALSVAASTSSATVAPAAPEPITESISKALALARVDPVATTAAEEVSTALTGAACAPSLTDLRPAPSAPLSLQTVAPFASTLTEVDTLELALASVVPFATTPTVGDLEPLTAAEVLPAASDITPSVKLALSLAAVNPVTAGLVNVPVGAAAVGPQAGSAVVASVALGIPLASVSPAAITPGEKVTLAVTVAPCSPAAHPVSPGKGRTLAAAAKVGPTAPFSARREALYWSGAPSFAVVDNSGSGNASESRAITAAESHDALDSTYEGLIGGGDGATLDGDANFTTSTAIQSASLGPVLFVRMKMRARITRTAGSGDVFGTWRPRMSGADVGVPESLTDSFIDYAQDFASDPADGAPWDQARINAKTFGLDLHATTVDVAVSTTYDLRVAEFSVEVWGPALVPSVALTLPLATVRPVGAGPGIEGLALLAVSTVGPAAPDMTQPALVGFGIAAKVFSPQVIQPLLDTHYASGSLGDHNLATKVFASTPGTWPNTGTLTVQQNVLGSTPDFGPIAFIIIKAMARIREDSPSTTTNERIQTAGGGVYPLTAIPRGPITPPVALYQTVETAALETQPNGAPWTWTVINNGFPSTQVKVDYHITGVGKFANLDVAELWLEVYGVLAQPETPERIELLIALPPTEAAGSGLSLGATESIRLTLGAP